MNNMVSLYCKIIFLLAMIGLALPSPAQTVAVPGINPIKQVTSAKEKTIANWWRYFEVEGEELKRRVGKVIESLDRLESNLPLAQSESL